MCPFKGNLAHQFMDVYFLWLSFHLDILSNRLETKKKGEKTGYPVNHRGLEVQFGNPLKFGFLNYSLCDVITLANPF